MSTLHPLTGLCPDTYAPDCRQAQRVEATPSRVCVAAHTHNDLTEAISFGHSGSVQSVAGTKSAGQPALRAADRYDAFGRRPASRLSPDQRTLETTAAAEPSQNSSTSDAARCVPPLLVHAVKVIWVYLGMASLTQV